MGRQWTVQVFKRYRWRPTKLVSLAHSVQTAHFDGVNLFTVYKESAASAHRVSSTTMYNTWLEFTDFDMVWVCWQSNLQHQPNSSIYKKLFSLIWHSTTLFVLKHWKTNFLCKQSTLINMTASLCFKICRNPVGIIICDNPTWDCGYLAIRNWIANTGSGIAGIAGIAKITFEYKSSSRNFTVFFFKC